MIRSLLLLSVLVLGLSAFKAVEPNAQQSSEITGERQAQKGLPQSKNPLWGKLALAKVSFDQNTGLYAIQLTPDVQAMGGQTVEISGFVLPLDGGEKTKHFLLSKRTPVCLYCPPGEPNEVVEVTTNKAIDWTEALVTVKGRFALVADGEKGIFFQLADAQATSGK